MDPQDCTPVSPLSATPSDLPLTPLTRRNTTSSAGSGRPIPAGHWILNLSGNCPRCHHHHRTVKIRVRASTASNRISDIDCTNCHALWLGSGTRNSTRISLLSANTIPEANLTEETEFRSTLIQIVRSATAIAALSPVLSGISETAAAGPSHTNTSRFPTQVRGSRPSESHLGDVHAWVNTSSRPPARSFSARISNSASSSSRYTQSRRTALLHLGRRIDGTFPNLKTSRLGRLMKLDTYTIPPPAEGTQANVGSSTMQASASRVSDPQHTEGITYSDNTAEVHGGNSGICTSPANAEEILTSAGLPDPDMNVISAMSVEERNAWMRTQITNFKAQLTRHSPVATSAMVDNSTQLNWADALPTSSIPIPFYDPTLNGIGNQFNPSFHWDPSRRSLSISETQLSQNDTLVDGDFAPSPYLPETLHRRPAVLRPASLHSPALQHLFQPRMNPRLSLDSVAAASIRSAASTTRERASIRRSWQAARGSGINRTEESASQNDWQIPLSGEVVGVETDRQPSPSSSPHREHRLST
jgi:hypothetical protein